FSLKVSWELVLLGILVIQKVNKGKGLIHRKLWRVRLNAYGDMSG
ncbi:MAG: hypothetical protein ACJA0X_003210, partial [Cyclobacteriaceae bacterium]